MILLTENHSTPFTQKLYLSVTKPILIILFGRASYRAKKVKSEAKRTNKIKSNNKAQQQNEMASLWFSYKLECRTICMQRTYMVCTTNNAQADIRFSKKHKTIPIKFKSKKCNEEYFMMGEKPVDATKNFPCSNAHRLERARSAFLWAYAWYTRSHLIDSHQVLKKSSSKAPV